MTIKSNTHVFYGNVSRLFYIFFMLTLSLSVHAQISIEGRYWQYGGQPIMLLGGWNHGHNPFIDHNTQDENGRQGVSTEAQIIDAMDELVDAGGNLLRCVLNPGMAAGIQHHNFTATVDTLYDLNDMTGPFWARLEMFISEAEKRNIIVQIEIWDRFDLINLAWNSWPVSPFNPKNNINYTTGESGLQDIYPFYINHPFLQGVPGHPVYDSASQDKKKQYNLVRSFQNKFIDKMLSITLKYDNILYCMNNETHEDPSWGIYWINYIRDIAKTECKNVLVTDMLDKIWEGATAPDWKYVSNNMSVYDYIDISQVNSRHRDQGHWDIIIGIANDAKKKNILLHMSKLYGNDRALDGKPWSNWKPGDTNNGVEEWWQNILAGVAGVRFHRPTSGLGLSTLAKNNMKSARLIESKIKFWNVDPSQHLLQDRESDEAYLAADPGKAYILYYPASGEGMVKLDLSEYEDIEFNVSWVEVCKGTWDVSKATTIQGGSSIAIDRPESGHWVAAITKVEN